MWGGSSKGSKVDIETGYYDEYGNWIEYDQEDDGNRIPDGNVHDREGRLLDPEKLHAELGNQEDPAVFISEFKQPRMVTILLFYNQNFLLIHIMIKLVFNC